MNIICETCWNDKSITDNSIMWSGGKQFLKRLKEVQSILIEKGKFKNIKIEKCLLCSKKNISSREFMIDNFKWNNGLIHYIEEHNIKPSDRFIDFIFRFKKAKKIMKRIFKFKSNRYIINDISYVKLKRNQILIMDALMIHGGYTKKYFDKDNLKNFKYSEHYGMLDFNDYSLERIIISGKTARIDDTDADILFPKEFGDVIEYEYIFHTHPPTPKPGGRVKDYILYESPSPNDILHFIYLFNKGLTQGSIIIAPEGLYNIRKYHFNKKKIHINEKKLLKHVSKILFKLQEDSIDKYGTDFTTHFFYSKVAQDTTFIDSLNKTLKEYKIFIDYYPRTNIKGKWIIDTIYLPIYVITKK